MSGPTGSYEGYAVTEGTLAFLQQTHFSSVTLTLTTDWTGLNFSHGAINSERVAHVASLTGPDAVFNDAIAIQILELTGSNPYGFSPNIFDILTSGALSGLGSTPTLASFFRGDANGTPFAFVPVSYSPPVPEPATWAMMLLGFGAMGLHFFGRRRSAIA